MLGEPGPSLDITDCWKDVPHIVSEFVFENLPHTWTLVSILGSGKLKLSHTELQRFEDDFL